jgi:hypothetical protein
MASDHASSMPLRETAKTEMHMDDDPVCELHDDGEDIFVLVDGVKIARRGRPDTAQAMTWVMLVPGWTVRDVQSGNAIEVRTRAHAFTNGGGRDGVIAFAACLGRILFLCFPYVICHHRAS